jgi:hypothetical protein
MKPRVITRTEDIAECGTRWLNRTTGRYHKTAIHALRAVQRRGKEVAGADSISAIVINWHATTAAGRKVIRCLSAL